MANEGEISTWILILPGRGNKLPKTSYKLNASCNQSTHLEVPALGLPSTCLCKCVDCLLSNKRISNHRTDFDRETNNVVLFFFFF
jgi:hypothetical protein